MLRRQTLQGNGIAGIDGGHRLSKQSVQEFRVVHGENLCVFLVGQRSALSRGAFVLSSKCAIDSSAGLDIAPRWR